ncbi:molybdopterin-synthase adenylyltransferase MoeB [uncultured Sphingomonas sp.]|uniref:HesA/MoeB/ThiF family protein n=1 Tax=uncultured Sphingomonas sp. TaxID=158754 RepID=UPI0025EDABE2|nr:molybdopterin-synthase adenylyltransferase MoeB [uncultured Sphingomonas sp.]
MNFSDAELDRYARHLVLREVGGAGQAALKAARVVVVGAGGIGSPALQYLAAAGVGTLAVIDDDRVDASNLQRQTLFSDADIGRGKVDAAAAAITRINPFVTVECHAVRIDDANAAALLAGAQVVLDGCDNFATRLTVADTALAARVPLVSAAVGQFEGQLGVFRGWEPHLPCYRCFVGDDPARADASCADQGVLGALTGIMGSMAALEVMRAIVGFGDDPAGKLLVADLLAFRFRTLTLPKDPGCRCAG